MMLEYAMTTVVLGTLKLLSKFGLKGANLYEYCDNNAINNEDTKGRFTIALFVSQVALAAIAALVALWALYKVAKMLSKIIGVFLSRLFSFTSTLIDYVIYATKQAINENKNVGSVWKLFDNLGRRIASLWADGTIRGK